VLVCSRAPQCYPRSLRRGALSTGWMQNFLRLGARVLSRDATALMVSPAALSGERIPMGDCWTGLRTKTSRPRGCGLDLVEMEGGPSLRRLEKKK
jgi:hypothetical protein